LSRRIRLKSVVIISIPNTDPSIVDAVRVLEKIRADDFDRQFRRRGYNRARMIIESRHDVKYEGGWEGLVG